MPESIDIQAELDRIRATLNAQLDALAETVRADSLPPEPRPLVGDRHTVVVFVKTFGGGSAYTYAAIRPSGRSTWSVTGKEGLTSVPWKRVAEFIVSDERHAAQRAVDSIQISTVTA